jgi:quinol-cytochrome oxidoreductase complex cytochrome b subunit
MTGFGHAVRLTVAAGFVLGFIVLGLIAALAPAAPLATVFVGSICATVAAIVVACELRPGLAQLGSARARGAEELSIRDLRRALDELPETPHPLGL